MKLNAPEGYNWTDAEVEYEKRDSFLTGVIVGVVLYTALLIAGLLLIDWIS